MVANYIAFQLLPCTQLLKIYYKASWRCIKYQKTIVINNNYI